MHELGIVFHVISAVEQVGRENELEQISAVTLELGEVSGVVPHELTACWNWAVKKSELLKDARLELETIPALTWCDNCKTEYPTVAHGRICPHCGSERTWLRQGTEINIKQIETR